MKSFLDHLKEEVLPSVQVADGGLDISKPAVRAAINAAIAGVVSQPAVTPYVVFNRLSKLLAQYHIVLPRRFLEGDKGVEVFELRQFGHKMGMTDSGEFVNEVPSTHYLFLQYGILSPFGITYAKPVVGGMFKVMARLVDKEELDKLMDMAEITMAEEAEVNQAIAKANAPREEMHDVTSDEKKKGNKEAVAASEKKSLDEEQIDEVSTEKLVSYRNKAGEGREKGTKLAYTKLTGKAKVKASAPKSAYMEEDKDPCWKGYEMIGMKKKGGKPVPNCVPVKEEEQIDEVSKRAAISAYREKEAQERDTGKLHGLIKKKFGAATAKHAERAGAADTGNLFRRGESHGVDRLASAKSSSEMRKSKDGKIHKQDVASKKSEIKFRKSMSKFDKPRGHLPEETQLDELKKSTLASYIKKAHVSGLEAASQGEIAYANKDKAGLRAANKTGEKREQGIERAAGKLAKEETISEKAPPGAKFERMVKHIKKGYAKDGLTAKEKSIAYATAWKSKKKSED